jgi:hypothetical protein
MAGVNTTAPSITMRREARYILQLFKYIRASNALRLAASGLRNVYNDDNTGVGNDKVPYYAVVYQKWLRSQLSAIKHHFTSQVDRSDQQNYTTWSKDSIWNMSLIGMKWRLEAGKPFNRNVSNALLGEM